MSVLTEELKRHKFSACFYNGPDCHTDVKLVIVSELTRAFHLLWSPKKTHVQFTIPKQVLACSCLSILESL